MVWKSAQAWRESRLLSAMTSMAGRKSGWSTHFLTFWWEGGQLLPAVSVSQVYRYLGVDISPRSTKANVTKNLKDVLLNISAAPPKTQQRLYIARCHLLPSLYHHLSPTSYKWLDQTTRAAVRSWLKLPHATVTPYFHSTAVDGGLGLPLLAHLSKLFSSFPHGTCSLSVSHQYLALDGVYHRTWWQIYMHSK